MSNRMKRDFTGKTRPPTGSHTYVKSSTYSSNHANFFSSKADDDFGTFEPEPEKIIKSCLSPISHDFEKKAYTTFFFDECRNCGYAPHYDYNREGFEQCHKEYMEYLDSKDR